MKRIACLILVLLLVFSSIAFAQKYDFKNDNYNAANIKRIVVICSIPDQNKQYNEDPYITQKLLQKTLNEINHQGKIRAVDLGTIIKRADFVNGCDVLKLGETNPDKSNAMLQNIINDYDAVLYINILRFGHGSTYQKATSYNTTQYKTSTVTGPYGQMATITTPETVTHTIPGGNVMTSEATVEFTLRDSKNNTIIFDRKDSRGCIPNHINNTEPIDMAKRMIHSYINDLEDKIDNDSHKLK